VLGLSRCHAPRRHLAEIKRRYDPNNLFRMNQNVGADELTHSQRKDEQQRPPIGEQNEPSS